MRFVLALLLLLATAPARAQWTEELYLERSHAVPDAVPSAIVHATPSLGASGPIDVVVFVHGWDGCVRQLAYPGRRACLQGERVREGWDLVGAVDRADARVLLVIPQLAFRARDGSPGRFAEPGFFERWLTNVLGAPTVLGHSTGPRTVRTVTLVAHSAGFETTIAMLDHAGSVPVRNVVLLDALYAGADRFARFIEESDTRRLVSVHGGRGRTQRFNAMLAGRLRARDAVVDPPRLEDAIGAYHVVVSRVRMTHDSMPSRLLGPIVAALFARS